MCYKQVLSEGRTMYLLFSLAVIWCRATGGFTGVGILCCLRQLILMPRQLISISQQRPRLRSCLTYVVLTQHCTKLSSRTSLRHFGERETACEGALPPLVGSGIVQCGGRRLLPWAGPVVQVSWENASVSCAVLPSCRRCRVQSPPNGRVHGFPTNR